MSQDFSNSTPRFEEGIQTSFWEAMFEHKASGYDELWRMPLFDRAALVQRGAPSVLLTHIAKDMNVSPVRLGALIGVSRTTVTRRLSSSKPFSPAESERLVGFAKLIGQVEIIMKESGAREGINPAAWFSEWIFQPAPALGGAKPVDLLQTADGRGAVSQLLSQMQSGAYA